jgi:hypothetical protein
VAPQVETKATKSDDSNTTPESYRLGTTPPARLGRWCGPSLMNLSGLAVARLRIWPWTIGVKPSRRSTGPSGIDLVDSGWRAARQISPDGSGDFLKCGDLNTEGEGFEPPKACTLVVFKTTAIDHSAIPPASTNNTAAVTRPDYASKRKQAPVRVARRHPASR